MARWQIKNVPDEVDEEVREIATKNRETLRTTVLQLVRQSLGSPAAVRGSPVALQTGTKGEVQQTTRVKFIPPTLEEAAAEIRTKGYHFRAEEFVAWNAARGWRTKQGPMKDWRAAMVTWEGRWKEREGAEAGVVGRARLDTRSNLSPAELAEMERMRLQGTQGLRGGE
jgi:hypothetical protein